MSADFYRAFEEKHRGLRERVKSHLRTPLPFVEPLTGLYADAKAVDLGCGRGEWLELLKEAGFDERGADTHLGDNFEWRDLALIFSVINTIKNDFVNVALFLPQLEYVQ